MTRVDRLKTLVQWIGIGVIVGVLCGASSALFLYVLEQATAFRNGHEFIVYTLPVAGLVIGWFYEKFGRSIEGGNNLIIDTIHDEGPEIPTRMAPMVLVGSVLTHLFGGSAGREGVSVQMGASLADGLSHRLKLTQQLRKQILAAGVAGGFGSVWSTCAGARGISDRRYDDARSRYSPHGFSRTHAFGAHAATAFQMAAVRRGDGRNVHRVYRIDSSDQENL
jgi:H+/Cl- antiporter ClcA